jgi:hypothetical protein
MLIFSQNDIKKGLVSQALAESAKKFPSVSVFLADDAGNIASLYVGDDIYKNEKRAFADGSFTPLTGEMEKSIGPYLSTVGNGQIERWKDLEKRKDREKWEKYYEEESSYDVAFVYGSAFYGESRDVDVLYLPVKGRQEVRRLESIFPGKINPVKTRAPDIQIDICKGKGAMRTLAVACVAKEYGGEVFKIPPEISLSDAIIANAERRSILAMKFPCDFLIRKALFSTVQEREWKRAGVFVDNKSQAIAALPSEFRETAERVLFHRGTYDDLNQTFRYLFQKEMPECLVYEKYHYFMVVTGGEILCSQYGSSDDEPYSELTPILWSERDNEELKKFFRMEGYEVSLSEALEYWKLKEKLRIFEVQDI